MEFAALTESVAFIPIPRNLFSFCSCISARLRLHGEMIYGDLRPEAERLVRVFYLSWRRRMPGAMHWVHSKLHLDCCIAKARLFSIVSNNAAAREAMRVRDGSAPVTPTESEIRQSRQKFCRHGARAGGGAVEARGILRLEIAQNRRRRRLGRWCEPRRASARAVPEPPPCPEITPNIRSPCAAPAIGRAAGFG